MVALCSNRPEGFGPISNLYSHVLTSCFLDTILIPLCTWLYLLALLIIFPILSFRLHSRKLYIAPRDNPSGVSDGTTLKEANPQLENANSIPHRRSLPKSILQVLYYLLILAQTLMCILEITRLSLASLGIGLLPFTIVGIIIAGLVHLLSTRFSDKRDRGSRSWTRWVNLVYWVALLTVNVVKIAEETKEGMGTRQGTKYPMADEVTDVGVMVGVYVALAVLECVT